MPWMVSADPVLDLRVSPLSEPERRTGRMRMLPLRRNGRSAARRGPKPRCLAPIGLFGPPKVFVLTPRAGDA